MNLGGRLRRLLPVLLGGVLAASQVGAHALAPSLLELTEGASGRVEVLFKTPVLAPAGSAELRPLLPTTCQPLEAPVTTREDTAHLTRWAVDCGEGGLAGGTLGIDGLEDGSGRDALVRVVLADGQVLQDLLNHRRTRFEIPERATRGGIAWRYLELGFEHILSGADHLLFVLGLLLLVQGWRALLVTITAFTLGHSITLALAVMGWAVLPSGPVEIAIAASLVVLAVEICRPPGDEPSLLRRRPWLVTGLFGLLHGLGFAGALAEVGLPQEEIPLALLSFNVGIEVGQLAFVAAALLAAFALRRAVRTPPPWWVRVPAYGIGTMGCFWIFERGMGLF
jgi:hydrogenase/urease accessory protein HupE